MRNYFFGLSLAVAAMMGAPPFMLAQAAPQSRPAAASAKPATSTPDLSGVWWRGRGSGRRNTVVFDPPPPMTPAALEKYKKLVDTVKSKSVTLMMLDPTIVACAPHGPTRLMELQRSIEIVQTPTKIIMIFEQDHWVRFIWTDGRKHPEPTEPSWMGHSIGKWEGDTLVVDTVGISDRTWLKNAGYPHSEALNVVERYRRVDQKTLELNVEYKDPIVYTKPWKGKILFEPDPMGEVPLLISCEDRIDDLMAKDPCESGAWELVPLCEERQQRGSK